jgi:hypothetical protein
VTYAEKLAAIRGRLGASGQELHSGQCCPCAHDLPALVGWAIERVGTLDVVFAQISVEHALRLSPAVQVLADESRRLLGLEVDSLAAALGIE